MNEKSLMDDVGSENYSSKLMSGSRVRAPSGSQKFYIYKKLSYICNIKYTQVLSNMALSYKGYYCGRINPSILVRVHVGPLLLRNQHGDL